MSQRRRSVALEDPVDAGAGQPRRAQAELPAEVARVQPGLELLDDARVGDVLLVMDEHVRVDRHGILVRRGPTEMDGGARQVAAHRAPRSRRDHELLLRDRVHVHDAILQVGALRDDGVDSGSGVL